MQKAMELLISNRIFSLLVIFPVACSDQLVRDLRADNTAGNMNIIRYSRFDQDQEGFKGSVKGHSTGITASKDKNIYTFLLSL